MPYGVRPWCDASGEFCRAVVELIEIFCVEERVYLDMAWKIKLVGVRADSF
jgi:hypothetical protein